MSTPEYVKQSQDDKKCTLLLIEDEVTVQSFLRLALEKNGFTCVLAPSGVEGLKMLQEGEFDGVISDMRTPGGVNGADVHAWLTANRPELARHMMFITGDIVNEETANILEQTGVPYIEKPFRIRELVEAVERLFQ
jgi:DNA-binding response OmpR family regulator